LGDGVRFVTDGMAGLALIAVPFVREGNRIAFGADRNGQQVPQLWSALSERDPRLPSDHVTKAMSNAPASMIWVRGFIS
jgi:hypothetical protein